MIKTLPGEKSSPVDSPVFLVQLVLTLKKSLCFWPIVLQVFSVGVIDVQKAVVVMPILVNLCH